MQPRLSHSARAFAPWLSKGTWTVLDQGLFAGSNFVLNVLLARWLSPEAYGAFTIGFTIFLLLAMVHGGLLNEPVLVFGAGRFQEKQASYLRAVLLGHGLFSILSFIVMLLAGAVVWMAGAPMVGAVLLALGATQPFILLLWLTRQTCYVQTRPQWAATGGMFYSVLLLAGTFVLSQTAWLSAASALGLMAFASTGAVAFILFRQRLNPFRRTPGDLRREALSVHWQYGRWAASTAILKWIPGYLVFLILPFWMSLEASGEYKALLNLIMPIMHASTALCTLLVPMFVRARETAAFDRLARLAFLVSFVGAGAYWLAMTLGGKWLIHVFYGGQYDHVAHLMWLVGSLPMLALADSLCKTLLKSIERPDLVFWAYLVVTGFALTGSIWLILRFGLVGAVIANHAEMVLEIGIMGWLLWRARRHIRQPATILPLETRRAA